MTLLAGGMQFYLKSHVAQVFSCKFCESFKNTCFVEHLRTAAYNLRTSVATLAYICKEIYLNQKCFKRRYVE